MGWAFVGTGRVRVKRALLVRYGRIAGWSLLGLLAGLGSSGISLAWVVSVGKHVYGGNAYLPNHLLLLDTCLPIHHARRASPRVLWFAPSRLKEQVRSLRMTLRVLLDRWKRAPRRAVDILAR